MSIITMTRPAKAEEIAAEMDRRGKVIEQLEARLAHIDGIYLGAIDNLSHHQRQMDMDGIEVAVSRQALCEVLDGLNAALATKPAVKDDETVVTDAMVDAASEVFADKMLMYDEDRDLIKRMLVAALAAKDGRS